MRPYRTDYTSSILTDTAPIFANVVEAWEWLMPRVTHPLLRDDLAALRLGRGMGWRVFYTPRTREYIEVQVLNIPSNSTTPKPRPWSR